MEDKKYIKKQILFLKRKMELRENGTNDPLKLPKLYFKLQMAQMCQ